MSTHVDFGRWEDYEPIMKCYALGKYKRINRAALLALAGILASSGAGAQGPLGGPPKGGDEKPGCSFRELRARLRDRLATMTPEERRGTEAILRMIAADFRVSFIAREVRVNPNGQETEAWVKRDPGRGFRVESIRPAGEIFLDDRKSFFVFQPKKNRWLQRESAFKMMRDHSEELSERLGKNRLRAVWQGQDTIAGRIADIVRIEPKGSDAGPSRRLWIDRQTGVRLKQEILGGDNRLLNSSYFLSVDLAPIFRPDDFSTPLGATIVLERKRTFKSLAEAAKAGVVPRIPSYLPSGFALRVVEATEDGDEKRRRITQRYANGLTVLSLIQVMDASRPGESLGVSRGAYSANPRGGGDRAYLWRDADFRYILLCSLSDDETRRIAESVK